MLRTTTDSNCLVIVIHHDNNIDSVIVWDIMNSKETNSYDIKEDYIII